MYIQFKGGNVELLFDLVKFVSKSYSIGSSFVFCSNLLAILLGC